MKQTVVSGIAVNRNLAKVSVLGVPHQPGIASHVLRTMADARIDSGAIVQNVGKDGKTDLSFTVHRSDCARTVELLLDQVLPALGALEVVGDAGVCEVSIVGTGMRSQVGVAGKVFGTLREAGIQAQMISTFEARTSVVIDETQEELAVRSLREAFTLKPQAAQAA
jgi:aspartate kinase